MDHTKESLLDVEAVCQLLAIKKSHLRSLVFKKEIPFIKVGKLLRFNTEQVKSWTEQHHNKQNN